MIYLLLVRTGPRVKDFNLQSSSEAHRSRPQQRWCSRGRRKPTGSDARTPSPGGGNCSICRWLTFLHHFVFSNVETGALAEDLEEKTGLRMSGDSGGLKLEQGFSCSRTWRFTDFHHSDPHNNPDERISSPCGKVSQRCRRINCLLRRTHIGQP